ncbi:hypothetical protein RHGRI_019013 [Rhododendron griersonianum]|uniref:Uncharacterized protein n=1 Tax=Rhododendron griersonianum TaxID=479676 RepID=A0AAV6JI93_9ERIC|nr:hypothetical protein RHGRI_019013 [Rhododendron griersonianum]
MKQPPLGIIGWKILLLLNANKITNFIFEDRVERGKMAHLLKNCWCNNPGKELEMPKDDVSRAATSIASCLPILSDGESLQCKKAFFSPLGAVVGNQSSSLITLQQ